MGVRGVVKLSTTLTEAYGAYIMTEVMVVDTPRNFVYLQFAREGRGERLTNVSIPCVKLTPLSL